MALIYYVIYPSAGGTPSAAQIKAGQQASGAAATASGSEEARDTTGVQDWAIPATGLTAGTTYKIAFVHADGSDPGVVESAAFRTSVTATLSAQAGAIGAFSRAAAMARTLSTTVGVIGNALRRAFAGLAASVGAQAAMARATAGVQRALSASFGVSAAVGRLRGFVQTIQASGEAAASAGKLAAFRRAPLAVSGASASLTQAQIIARALSDTVGVVYRRALRSWNYETIQYVNSTAKLALAGWGTSASSDALSVTAGNLLVVSVRYDSYDSTQDTITLSDTAGNEWTGLTPRKFGSSAEWHQTFYAWDCKGHASNVVTASFSDTVSMVDIAVVQYANADVAADPFEGEDFIYANPLTDTPVYAGVTATRGGVLHGFVCTVYNSSFASDFTPIGATERLEVFNGGTPTGTWVYDTIYDTAGAKQVGVYINFSEATSQTVLLVQAFRGRAGPGLAVRTLSAAVGAVGGVYRHLAAALGASAGTAASRASDRPVLMSGSAGAQAVANAVLVAQRALSGAVGVAAGAIRSLGRVIATSAGVAAGSVRQLVRSLVGAAGLAGTLDSAAAVARALSGSAGSAATSAMLQLKTVAASATVGMQAAVHRAFGLVRSAAAGAQAGSSRLIDMVRSAAVGAAGGVEKGAGIVQAAVVGAVASSASAIGRAMLAAAGALGGVSSKLDRVMVAVVGLVPAVRRGLSLALDAAAGVLASIFQGLEGVLRASVGAVGVIEQGVRAIGRLVMRLVVRPAAAVRDRIVRPSMRVDKRGINDD